jgi:hypothetical protein
MADYTKTKGRAVWPDNATDTAWNRLEPLVTADQVRTQHLFGIPLYSAIRDPRTNQPQEMTDDIIRVIIERAVSIAEMETGLDIMPVQRAEKHPFDRAEYESFGYFRTLHRPVASIEALKVVPSNNVPVYDVPLEWVEVGSLPMGQINIVPLTVATNMSGYQPVQSAGGAVFLSIFASRTWMPGFWEITYTSGFVDGKLPKIVNELIGVIAAMEVLSMLGATYARTNSTSLGIDGMSQSVSTPGPQVFLARLQDLETKRKWITSKLKAKFGLRLFSGNV